MEVVFVILLWDCTSTVFNIELGKNRTGEDCVGDMFLWWTKELGTWGSSEYVGLFCFILISSLLFRTGEWISSGCYQCQGMKRSTLTCWLLFKSMLEVRAVVDMESCCSAKSLVSWMFSWLLYNEVVWVYWFHCIRPFACLKFPKLLHSPPG